MQLTEATAIRSTYNVPFAMSHMFCLALLQQSAKFGIIHPISQVRKLMLWNIKSPIHGYINKKVGESNLKQRQSDFSKVVLEQVNQWT